MSAAREIAAEQWARLVIARSLDICDCGNPTDPTCQYCAPGQELLAEVTAMIDAALQARERAIWLAASEFALERPKERGAQIAAELAQRAGGRDAE